MECLDCFLLALLLLNIANGAPVVADRLLDHRLAAPVDLGYKLHDGRAVFGSAKTWRGLLVSLGLTALTSGLFGIGVTTGIRFALLSMLGDLMSSFIKRRLGLSESSRARGLDTVPESVLPAAILKESLGLDWLGVVLVAVCFLLIEEVISPLLYKLHIRKRPY
ncbi:MAG: CDP-archaeol synthase [Gammaproteobacteria bacterium]